MLKAEILRRIDHTELRPNATAEDYSRLCEEAQKYQVASICVPPAWVKFCRQLVPESVKVCTVVGFPLGYNASEVKVYEAQHAILSGAREIDMVINIGFALSANQLDDSWLQKVKDEIVQVRQVCEGNIILKVIIETCYLNEAQKINLCHAVTEAGADFIKTSTGFGPQGATLRDIELFKTYLGPNVKIKAAGGISTIDQAVKFIRAGCERIGSSKLVRLLAETDQEEFE